MTLYDSSVLIDYLDGVERAREYVAARDTERAVAPRLVQFEVYQGEVFKSGSTDLAAVDDALDWLLVEEADGTARHAAELQDTLRSRGEPLAAREAFIAGAASAANETLAVADGDFDVPGLTDELSVDFL
jgi:predicted nucleic acid-binding protein